MNAEEALEEFGLTNREVKVYLALLGSGTTTAYEIARKTGILRQTVYDILTALIEKGLVSQIIKSSKQHFEAAEPDKLKSILKEKEKVLESVLPNLKLLREATKTKPKVEFYEGVEGLKTIYDEIIRKANILYEYGNAENFARVLKWYFIENYIQRRVEAKIKLKLLVEKDKKTKDISKTNKKLFRETRCLPIMGGIKTINYIYQDKFVILTLTKEPIGIIIQNKEIAEAQKKMFETLWNIAEKY